MSVVIRLAKTGKRGIRRYRIIAIDKREKRDSSPLEILGFFSPDNKDSVVRKDRIAHWQAKGAQVSQAVSKLL